MNKTEARTPTCLKAEANGLYAQMYFLLLGLGNEEPVCPTYFSLPLSQRPWKHQDDRTLRQKSLKDLGLG